MRFVRLEFKHLSQMAEIEREAFEMPWTENMFIPEVEDPSATYVVGVRGEEVICYGGFHKVLDEAHITNIAVKSTERGRGIGGFLLAELISRARNLGVERMTLEVRDGNVPAIKLYESFGFKVEGVRKKYYDNKFDALIMWLTL
ncbi:MAG: ribosomal protein S18-alanine N-acetyltransferase [Clostridia bacterium]|nr:ribosomal protein S18-alanine N-acetyltransferase [Clostridia bacterium]MBQ3754740.1 ribosomal protein S18-alanine N-acetyltransferase [Clostridia bacterium]